MRVPSFGVMILLLTLAAGCSREQTGEAAARRALDEAAEVMGGWEALRSVAVQRVTSEGTDWEPIQAFRPGETRQVNRFTQTSTADFARPAIRLEFRAELLYPAERPEQFTEVIGEGAGLLEQVDARRAVQKSRLHESRTATHLRDLKRMPVRVLLTAAEASGLNRLPDEVKDGISFRVLQYTDGGQTVKLRLDSSTHLPASVAYLEDDGAFGDTWNELRWSDWREVGGVKLPYTQEQWLNDLVFRKETVQEIQNNPSVPADAFSVPEEIRAQPAVGEPVVSQWVLRRAAMGVSYLDFSRPQNAPLSEVAPGVWLAGGAGHQSLIIEMNDHLMIVEAPLYEERSLAVMQAAREKFPSKPIRSVVMTHFHVDHSGGIRAYAAEGITIVAHSSILPFIRTVVDTPRTVKPDSLARKEAAGQKPSLNLEGVDGMKEYTDGRRVLRLYHLNPNPHAEGMLLAYLPRERITFDADMVSPANPMEAARLEPRTLAYYDFVKQNGLPVDRIARVHGPVIPFRAFAAVAEKAR